MSTIRAQTKEEIKQLPFMLGKLLGGAMSVIGFPGVILVVTRKANPSASDVLPYIFLGILGIAVFLLSSKLHAKRMKENVAAPLPSKDKIRTSIISWLVLLALAASFLLICFIMSR